MQAALIGLIQSHPTTALFAAEIALNTLVGAMEEPTAQSGQLYRYVYRLGHALSLNFQYAFTKKFPTYQALTPTSTPVPPPTAPPTPPTPTTPSQT